MEEIDLGNGNVRQVVSGLAKFYSPEDLTVNVSKNLIYLKLNNWLLLFYVTNNVFFCRIGRLC